MSKTEVKLGSAAGGFLSEAETSSTSTGSSATSSFSSTRVSPVAFGVSTVSLWVS